MTQPQARPPAQHDGRQAHHAVQTADHVFAHEALAALTKMLPEALNICDLSSAVLSNAPWFTRAHEHTQSRHARSCSAAAGIPCKGWLRRRRKHGPVRVHACSAVACEAWLLRLRRGVARRCAPRLQLMRGGGTCVHNRVSMHVGFNSSHSHWTGLVGVWACSALSSTDIRQQAESGPAFCCGTMLCVAGFAKTNPACLAIVQADG